MTAGRNILNPRRKDINVPGVFTTTDSMNASNEPSLGRGKFFFLSNDYLLGYLLYHLFFFLH